MTPRRTAIWGWRDRLSLGQQAALMMTALSCLLVLACAGVAATITRDQASTRVEASMHTLAVNVARALDHFMLERLQVVEDLTHYQALAPVFAGGGAPLRQLVESVRQTYPDYTWIGFADTEGRVISATDGLLEGQSVAERPWFQHAQSGPTLEDVHDATLLASLLGHAGEDEPVRFVDVAVPVHDADGALLGVLGAHLSWQWARHLRDALLGTLSAASKTDLWLLRGDGRVVLGPNYDSMPLSAARIATIHEAGRTTFVDDTGAPVLTAAAMASTAIEDGGMGWIVLARRPLAFAFRDSDALVLTIIMLGAALILVGSGTGWWLSMRLTRPLQQLTEQVDQVGRRPGANTVIEREMGSADLQRLSAAIRALLRRLDTAEDAGEAARQRAELLQKRMEQHTRTMGEHISSLQTLADTDPLTRLLNRRAFMSFAADAVAHYRRYQRPIAVLVVDIDHFKQINDTYGHGVGDDVITHVGQTITQMVRSTDKVARFGGEEFVGLLREIDREQAEQLADRIRATIAEKSFSFRGHENIKVTISVGLAMADPGDRDVSDLIERADRGLYQAKTSGRDRVVFIESTPLTDAA